MHRLENKGLANPVALQNLEHPFLMYAALCFNEAMYTVQHSYYFPTTMPNFSHITLNASLNVVDVGPPEPLRLRSDVVCCSARHLVINLFI